MLIYKSRKVRNFRKDVLQIFIVEQLLRELLAKLEAKFSRMELPDETANGVLLGKLHFKQCMTVVTKRLTKISKQ